MIDLPPEPDHSGVGRKRRLRAALSADVANFSGRVSVSETRAFGHLSTILRIGNEEIARYEGLLIVMTGDGLFALFESAVDAVRAALAMQQRLSLEPNLDGMRLRIGIHLGEVLFDGEIPFGETLNIAARLQSLAEPGGILVSAAVVDTVSARVAATFEERGVPQLKNIPRRIATFSVRSADGVPDQEGEEPIAEPLDHTMQFSRRFATSPPPLPTASAPPKAEPQRVPPIAQPPTPTTREAPLEPLDGPAPAADAAAGVSVPSFLLTQRQLGRAAPPSSEQVSALVEMLAVHLGPIARVVTARKAKDAASLAELVARLEAEVPAAERSGFRARVQRLLGL